jgi:hypothetical protein
MARLSYVPETRMNGFLHGWTIRETQDRVKFEMIKAMLALENYAPPKSRCQRRPLIGCVVSLFASNVRAQPEVQALAPVC